MGPVLAKKKETHKKINIYTKNQITEGTHLYKSFFILFRKNSNEIKPWFTR